MTFNIYGIESGVNVYMKVRGVCVCERASTFLFVCCVSVCLIECGAVSLNIESVAIATYHSKSACDIRLT